jgi:hypothetical protein
MQIALILTVGFGVYSPLYANGGLLVFFIALCNVYVWSLIYLNWPVDDHLYEFPNNRANSSPDHRQ